MNITVYLLLILKFVISVYCFYFSAYDYDWLSFIKNEVANNVNQDKSGQWHFNNGKYDTKTSFKNLDYEFFG